MVIQKLMNEEFELNKSRLNQINKDFIIKFNIFFRKILYLLKSLNLNDKSKILRTIAENTKNEHIEDTSSNLPEVKEKINNFLDLIISLPIDEKLLSEIPSLGEISKKLGNLDSKTLSTYIKNQYLPKRFGARKALETYNNIWARKNPRLNIEEKKENFNTFIEKIIMQYQKGEKLPMNIGIRALGRKFDITRMTVPKWIRRYLELWLVDNGFSRFSPEEIDAYKELIYREIWSSKKGSLSKNEKELLKKVKKIKRENQKNINILPISEDPKKIFKKFLIPSLNTILIKKVK